MQDEKWQDIVGRVKDDFEVIDHQTVVLDPGPGKAEFIIFNGPLGKMKLELTTRPLVLGEKAFGSKRIGSQTKVEFQYSETETTRSFKAYKWDEGQADWIKIEAGPGFNL